MLAFHRYQVIPVGYLWVILINNDLYFHLCLCVDRGSESGFFLAILANASGRLLKRGFPPESS